jgi:hypothetical protein
MPVEPSDFDPQNLWQSQATEHEPMTIAEIHEKARTFQARVRRRNMVEYVAAAVAILGFLPALLQRGSWMMQVGAGLVMAAIAFVVWQLHRRASAQAVPEAGEAVTAFHRRELIRQRDAIRSVGLWYISPAIPGMAMILLGRWFQSPAPHRSVALDHLIIALVAVIAILVLLAIWLLNQRGAKRLQRRIDEL